MFIWFWCHWHAQVELKSPPCQCMHCAAVAKGLWTHGALHHMNMNLSASLVHPPPWFALFHCGNHLMLAVTVREWFNGNQPVQLFCGSGSFVGLTGFCDCVSYCFTVRFRVLRGINRCVCFAACYIQQKPPVAYDCHRVDRVTHGMHVLNLNVASWARPLAALRCARPRVTSNASVEWRTLFSRGATTCLPVALFTDAISSVLGVGRSFRGDPSY